MKYRNGSGSSMAKSQILLKAFLLVGSLLVGGLVAPAGVAQAKTISLYKIVPGKHLEFIQWMAAWDEVYAEIDLEQPIWYRNISGDTWDFLVIYPPFDHAKEDEMEEVGKGRGLAIGFAWKLKHWEFMAESSGTLVQGPTTPAELLKSLETK